jgi:hypothetical protein
MKLLRLVLAVVCLTALVCPASALGQSPSTGQGRSGAVRVAVVRALDALNAFDLPFVREEQGPDGGVRYRWLPLFGTREEAIAGDLPFQQMLQTPGTPGVWRLLVNSANGTEEMKEVDIITQVPFAAKKGRHLNGYRIGIYPTEGSGRQDQYAPPSGFIEVTPENLGLHVSENFRLGQFITKDQHDVWPKYVALDLRLIDKLELVLQELNAMGVRANYMQVMSGFRTPHYNAFEGSTGGRGTLSRHMYGDAADIWVDNDADGYIDDLNGDGRRDIDDARVIVRAVDRVEKRYPELVGGTGLYLENSAHGPFVHIDARGYEARW